MSKYLKKIKYIFLLIKIFHQIDSDDPSITLLNKYENGYEITMFPEITTIYFEKRHEKIDLIKTESSNDYFFTEFSNFVEFEIPENVEVNLKFFGNCILPIFFSRDPKKFSNSIFFKKSHLIFIRSDSLDEKLESDIGSKTEISEILKNEKKIKQYTKEQKMLPEEYLRIGVVYCLIYNQNNFESIEFEATWKFTKNNNSPIPPIDPKNEDENPNPEEEDSKGGTLDDDEKKDENKNTNPTDPESETNPNDNDQKEDDKSNGEDNVENDKEDEPEDSKGEENKIQENIEEMEIPDDAKVVINENEIILDMETGGSEVFYENVFSLEKNEIKKVVVKNLMKNTEIRIKDLKENFLTVNLLYDQYTKNIDQKIEDIIVDENLVDAKNLQINLKLKDNTDKSFFSIMTLTSKSEKVDFWTTTNSFILIFFIVFTITFFFVILLVIFYKKKKKILKNKKNKENIIRDDEMIPSELIPVYKLNRKNTMTYKSEMSGIITFKKSNKISVDSKISYPSKLTGGDSRKE